MLRNTFPSPRLEKYSLVSVWMDTHLTGSPLFVLRVYFVPFMKCSSKFAFSLLAGGLFGEQFVCCLLVSTPPLWRAEVSLMCGFVPCCVLFHFAYSCSIVDIFIVVVLQVVLLISGRISSHCLYKHIFVCTLVLIASLHYWFPPWHPGSLPSPLHRPISSVTHPTSLWTGWCTHRSIWLFLAPAPEIHWRPRMSPGGWFGPRLSPVLAKDGWEEASWKQPQDRLTVWERHGPTRVSLLLCVPILQGS